MTAQEYLDELERLRKAAIMPPYYILPLKGEVLRRVG